MTKDEAEKLLRGGTEGIQKWNQLRNREVEPPDLEEIDLNDAILREVDLSWVNLTGANFGGADLRLGDLESANLSDAVLLEANLSYASLYDADLREASLSGANLTGADLGEAKLSGAELSRANLCASNLQNSDLRRACVIHTRFADVDLSAAKGLDSVHFFGPCSIDSQTLVKSKGHLPDSFLEGCGFQRWQVLAAKLHDPDLTPLQITDLQNEIFIARTKGPIHIGGVFISYAHEDSGFIDKLRDRLLKEGANVWVDRHDAVAGPLRQQVVDQIRLNDVIVVVLSESSLESNWVESEIKKALQKEVDEGRDVLCPVALDDTWKKRLDESLWREVAEKNVLDFSQWKTKAFEKPFGKLLKGLKIYYPPKDEGSPAAT